MNRKLRAALNVSGLAALALATASCGGAPPNPQSQTDRGNFSLFNPMGQWPSTVPAFSEADYFGDALPPLPEAAPMVRTASREGGYRYAPSYDYPADEPVYYDSEPSDNSYAWLALASSLGGVFDDAPPDYYFDYDGVEPWVWETGDDFVRYAEPLDYGYRYYYYAPGRSYPFLVRDPYYSYGYYDDRVVVIYDRDGRVLDGRRSWRQRQAADRYYARAHALNEASRLRPRYGIAAPLWAERRPIIAGEQRQWDTARTQRAGWRNWDRRNEQVTAPRWTRERVARQYAARRFDTWQNQDYRGPAPRFYDEAERSPRLRQAMAEQRDRAVSPRVQRREALAQRREQMRAFAPGDNVRRGGDWQASPSVEPRIGWTARNADRDEARVERQRGRQARFEERQARRSGFTAQRGPNEARPAQAERRAFTRQRQVEQQRVVSTDRGHAEAFRAQREARAQQRAQFRAAQGQEQRQARMQQREQSRVQQRAQAMQSQQREQVRAQRVQAQSQQRQEFRAQRAQAQSQQRQEFRSQQRAQFQQQRNEAAMQQRTQARQEARAQQHQQRAQMQAQQSQAREQVRAQRQEQRAQAQQQSGGDQANGHAQRMAERQSRGGGRGDRRMD